jgi:hypothetical protein
VTTLGKIGSGMELFVRKRGWHQLKLKKKKKTKKRKERKNGKREVKKNN